jgi:hypothetical protein
VFQARTGKLQRANREPHPTEFCPTFGDKIRRPCRQWHHCRCEKSDAPHQDCRPKHWWPIDQPRALSLSSPSDRWQAFFTSPRIRSLDRPPIRSAYFRRRFRGSHPKSAQRALCRGAMTRTDARIALCGRGEKRREDCNSSLQARLAIKALELAHPIDRAIGSRLVKSEAILRVALRRILL